MIHLVRTDQADILPEKMLAMIRPIEFRDGPDQVEMVNFNRRSGRAVDEEHTQAIMEIHLVKINPIMKHQGGLVNLL